MSTEDAPLTMTPEEVAAAMPTKAGVTVLAEVADERSRQDAKWGEQNHPDGTGPKSTPVAEIVRGPANGIVNRHYAFGLASNAKSVTDEHAADGTVTFRDILLEEVFAAMAESDPEKLRTELIQVAAVATQWVEAIDRREATK
jgi:hypothetical protein